jgi:hypothetical protein
LQTAEDEFRPEAKELTERKEENKTELELKTSVSRCASSRPTSSQENISKQCTVLECLV